MTTDDTDQQSIGRNDLGGFATTAVEAVIIATSLLYILVDNLVTLLVWEVLAVVYFAVGFTMTRRRSLRPNPTAGRVGVLDTLSWVLPLAASVVGINSAITVLIKRSDVDVPRDERVAFLLAGAVGIILSWQLLHTGLANVYEKMFETRGGLVFPGDAEPTFGDFLYFSFTIGSSFATSDVTVLTTRVRWVVMVHNVISFLYNALVVAVAFQVLQQLSTV